MKRWILGFLMVGAVGIAIAGEVSEPTYTYTDSSNLIGVRTFRARGQYPSPAKINSGDLLGGFYGYGYGTAFQSSPGASIRLKANQDWSASAQGTKITFETTPDDSTTAAEVASFDDNGKLTLSGGIASSSTTFTVGSVQQIIWSSHTIVPSSSFVLISSTGNMVMNSSLAASISTTSVTNGFRLVLLSTAARISIPTTITGGEAARVYSSTGGAYINVTTMTPVEFMWYGSFWRNISELRP